MLFTQLIHGRPVYWSADFIAVKMVINNSESGLRIVSYNCRSVKNSVGTVKALCQTNDIILIQEHWLMSDELIYLSTIDPEFVFFGSSAVDINSALLCGRPYGGTVILCRLNIADNVKLVKCNNPHITAVELTVSLNESLFTILLASIYMPVDVCGGQTDEDFEFVCGYLKALIVESHVSGYKLARDLNFHFKSPRHKTVMKAFDDHHVVLVDEYALDASSFTYASDSHNTTSWIDHVLTNQWLLSFVSNMSVLYEIVSSDHRPLCFSLAIDKIKVCSNFDNTEADSVRIVSDWATCSQSKKDNYARRLDYLLQTISLPPICCTLNCGITDHQNDIDEYFRTINTCINTAMHSCIPVKRSCLSDFCVAGWTDIVADKHEAARQAFLEWVICL